jgi:hypothetical protein
LAQAGRFVHPSRMIRGTLTLGLVGLSILGAAACKGANVDASLSKPAPAPEQEGIPNVPVPPEDGPRLHARRGDVAVLEAPADGARAIGALRFGASVARAAEPYKTTSGCEGGYYPVRPRGFVCASADVSLEGGPHVATPASDRALPYRYGTVRSATPLYARLPTPGEQLENEPDLGRHLPRASKDTGRSLRPGANDVPLDDHGVAAGPAVIARNGEGVDAEGRRTRESFFSVLSAAPPPGDPASPPVAAVLRRGSGVAVAATFDAQGPEGPRRFAMTPDGRYVAVDRLEPALGSVWHGVDLTKDRGLPLGFVLRHETCPYELARGKAKRLEDEEVERRHAVFLTGRFRTVDAIRYEEVEEGRWYRDKDLIKVVKRSKFPDFVQADTKWVDVSLALQTMTLYEGKKAIYATLVSSGQELIGDPTTTASTAMGTFKIERKAFGSSLDPREVGQAFDVFDAPWTIEFSPGFAFVGSYWSDPGGEARQFHNVALTPIDARRLFVWAGPEIPTGWRWIAPADGEQIVVHVRK